MTLKKIFQNSIYVPALLPLYSIKLVSISIFIFVLHALFTCNYDELKKNKLKDVIKIVFPYTFLFFLYVVSLLWTDNVDRGLLYIEHTLSFVIFPITIFVFRPFKSVRQIGIFIKTFIISSGLLGLFTLIYIGHELYANYYETLIIENFIRERIEMMYIIGEHPIYFSLLLATGLVLLFYYNFKNRWVNVVILIINVTGIMLAASRGTFLALIIVAVVAIYFRMKSKKKALLTVFILIIFAITSIMVTPLKNRMKELTHIEQMYPKGIYHNSFSIRMAIYKCSFNLIQKNIVIGYGPGDIENKMKKCFKKFDTDAFDAHTYNTHNQYLHYLCAFGILGTLIVLYYFRFYLISAWGANNMAYLITLLLFYISFLTENILVRNTGIVLFSMFNTLFAFLISLESQKKREKLIQ